MLERSDPKPTGRGDRESSQREPHAASVHLWHENGAADGTPVNPPAATQRVGRMRSAGLNPSTTNTDTVNPRATSPPDPSDKQVGESAGPVDVDLCSCTQVVGAGRRLGVGVLAVA